MNPQKERPNIIVIMSDQHNPHITGYDGNNIIRTPNLDRLANQGTYFSNTYCPYPLCVPSRMSFMTGQYASDIRIWNNVSTLASDIPTFAHSLGIGGYESVLCGRMHFVGHDQFHGFEKRIYGDCMVLGNGKSFLPKEIMGSGHKRTNGQTAHAVAVSGHGHTGYSFYDQEVTNLTCDFITTRKTGERPFCMVVGYMLPHNPLICKKELFDYYLKALPVPELLSEEDQANLHPAIRKWRERRQVNDLTPQQSHRALAAYYSLVEEMDCNIGRVLDTIDSSGQKDNTIIIYTSDHGDMACEQGGMWWKSSFFEGSARIPLLVSAPSRYAGCKNVKSIVSGIDLAPTILDMAGCPPLPDISGKTLLGFLENEVPPADWPNEVFSEFIGAHGDKPSCMLRSGQWKLIYYSEFDSCLLFDLEDDPEELNDRAQDPACETVVKTLIDKINARWSAEEMEREGLKEWRDLDFIRRCGHDLIPHEITYPNPPESANYFDFSQI